MKKIKFEISCFYIRKISQSANPEHCPYNLLIPKVQSHHYHYFTNSRDDVLGQSQGTSESSKSPKDFNVKVDLFDLIQQRDGGTSGLKEDNV